MSFTKALPIERNSKLSSVKVDQRYGWKTTNVGPLIIHSIGRQASIDKFISTLDPKELPDMQVLKKELASLYGCYGLIVESKNWISSRKIISKLFFLNSKFVIASFQVCIA